MTRSLLAMADWLTELGVTRVVMEATTDYWKPPFYLLEANGFDVWLVNAKDVKHLPGRPKTDRLDAVWLCKVAERQMLRPSFVPPAADPRAAGPDPVPGGLVADRTAEKNRVEKLLEDAQIKLSVVATDIFGVSGRAMMAALVAGERDPKVLANWPATRMRTKTAAAGGGVRRAVHRPSRVPAAHDAGPHRHPHRRHRPASRPGSRSRSPLSPRR